jgi:hypothetical protein
MRTVRLSLLRYKISYLIRRPLKAFHFHSQERFLCLLIDVMYKRLILLHQVALQKPAIPACGTLEPGLQ